MTFREINSGLIIISSKDYVTTILASLLCSIMQTSVFIHAIQTINFKVIHNPIIPIQILIGPPKPNIWATPEAELDILIVELGLIEPGVALVGIGAETLPPAL